MLQVSEEVHRALKTHQGGDVHCSAFYMGAMTAPTVRLDTNGSIRFDGAAEVQAQGTVLALGSSGSLVPRFATDPLGTYGQELAIWRTVMIGDQSWDIPLGRYPIQRAYDSDEHHEVYGARSIVTSWKVSLKVNDRFEAMRADDFLQVESPKPGNSVYQELRRICPVPVQESLADRPVPPSTVYDSRLGAITALCAILGGTPHLTREGVLRPRLTDGWLTVTTKAFDIEGVIEWADDMSNDFINQVQVRSSSNNDLVAFRSITDASNPRAVSRAGGRTYKAASPIYETQGAVDAAADTMLARLSSGRSRVIEVVCGPEAILLELGDVGWIRDPRTGRAAMGEVTEMEIPLDPLAGVQVSLIVAEES
jgi:hypothetical protein